MDEDKPTPEQEKYEADYKRGYNNGVILAEFMPDIAKDILSIESDSPMAEGFKAGKHAYEIEQQSRQNQNLPRWAQRDIDKEFNEVAKPKDIDIEPEH